MSLNPYTGEEEMLWQSLKEKNVEWTFVALSQFSAIMSGITACIFSKFSFTTQTVK